jgi:hypothetical protein
MAGICERSVSDLSSADYEVLVVKNWHAKYIVACRTFTVQRPRDMQIYTRALCRERPGRHVSAATYVHATIEVLLETMFSTRFAQRGNKENNWGNGVISVRESVRKRGSWKGAAAQRGLEHVKLKNLQLLEAVTRQLLVKTLRAGTDLA